MQYRPLLPCEISFFNPNSHIILGGGAMEADPFVKHRKLSFQINLARVSVSLE